MYKNKYRIESTRLKNWNYSQDASYFITICIKDRQCLFGEIIDGKMILSEIGKIIENEWLKSFEIRTELFCDIFCIMPNHIHAIVIIKNDNAHEQTHGRASLQELVRLPKSISSFVAGFKSSATKTINHFRQTPRIPIWQSRFHDNIIRNEIELNLIRQYIVENPSNWNLDDQD